MNGVYYNFDELKQVDFEKISSKKVVHINNICTFDIECSNGFRLDNGKVIAFSFNRWRKWNRENQARIDAGLRPEKRPAEYKNPVALMYHWQSAIEINKEDDPIIFFGRTWEEFKEYMNTLAEYISDSVYAFDEDEDDDIKSFIRSKQKKLIYAHIYVHNLSYEFQFMRNIFKFEKVFAREERKPMRAETFINGVTFVFHDTLSLTQKSLHSWCEDENLKVKKYVEANYDYLTIKTPLTKLTKKELKYCRNDVECMVYGVRKYRDKYAGELTRIPMTQTGEVRIVAREKISAVNMDWATECYLIDHTYDYDLYYSLVEVFAGGWTHANKLYTGKLQHNVKCFDFASSYPSVLTSSRHFPISQWTKTNEEKINWLNNIENIEDRPYCYIMRVKCYNMVSNMWNTYWSSNKTLDLQNCVLDNGRIMSADVCEMWVTDIDWNIITRAYEIEDYEILDAYEAEAGYICKEFILTILSYFKDKTALKGTGETSKYNAAKQFINSLYGCCVTKLAELTDQIEFDDDGWSKHVIATIEEFEANLSVEENEKRFMNEVAKTFTTWGIGVYTTAIARYRLWTAIFEFDDKIVYCDTDSAKGLFDDEDLKWFDNYNLYIGELQQKCADYYDFDSSLYKAKTSKGKLKQLGIWEREDDCEEFKTLGAKRYVASHNGEIECTIAGLPKKAGLINIHSVDELEDNLFWTPKQSGKLISHYNDNQAETIWYDKQGQKYVSNDKYGIMLEPTSFTLSLSDDYDFLVDLLTDAVTSDLYKVTHLLRNKKVA